MILAPLTRWWGGQFLYGRGCVVEVKEIDPEEWLKIWILNGHYHCWYDPQTLEHRFEDGGPAGSFFEGEPFQEIVQIDAGQYWPAIDGQYPPWETPPDAAELLRDPTWDTVPPHHIPF